MVSYTIGKKMIFYYSKKEHMKTRLIGFMFWTFEFNKYGFVLTMSKTFNLINLKWWELNVGIEWPLFWYFTKYN